MNVNIFCQKIVIRIFLKKLETVGTEEHLTTSCENYTQLPVRQNAMRFVTIKTRLDAFEMKKMRKILWVS